MPVHDVKKQNLLTKLVAGFIHGVSFLIHQLRIGKDIHQLFRILVI